MTARLHMRLHLPDQELVSFAKAASRTVVPLEVMPLDTLDDAMLASLLYAAYHGTIDDEGESFDDALGEIRRTLGGQYGQVIAEASGAIGENDKPVAAIVATKTPIGPLIAYAFTMPSCQRRGYATRLFARSCAELASLGYDHVDLMVTAGNPAESLYRKFGFCECDSTQTDADQ